MKDSESKNVLGLGKGARITVGILSFIFAVVMLSLAYDPPKPELGILNALPSIFGFFIVGACILPPKISVYCGDIIALSVIILAIWYLFSSISNPQPGDNPIGFAIVFGGAAVTYLWKRYGKFFIKQAS